MLPLFALLAFAGFSLGDQTPGCGHRLDPAAAAEGPSLDLSVEDPISGEQIGSSFVPGRTYTVVAKLPRETGVGPFRAFAPRGVDRVRLTSSTGTIQGGLPACAMRTSDGDGEPAARHRFSWTAGWEDEVVFVATTPNYASTLALSSTISPPEAPEASAPLAPTVLPATPADRDSAVVVQALQGRQGLQQSRPALLAETTPLVAQSGERCTGRGPMIIKCADGLECSAVPPTATDKRPLSVCSAPGSEAIARRDAAPEESTLLKDECPAARTEEIYSRCNGMRFGWAVAQWSWDTAIDSSLDTYRYGGFPAVARAPVCAGPGAVLPTVDCECENNYLGTCGYINAKYTKGFGALSFRTTRPVPIGGALRFRLQIDRDPDELELALQCPEQVFMGPPTILLQLQSGAAGADGTVTSNQVDLRRCMTEPSSAIAAGCWAIYEIAVSEGSPTMEQRAFDPCTLYLPEAGNAAGSTFDTVLFKNSLSPEAEEAGCGVSNFYIADVSVCKAEA